MNKIISSNQEVLDECNGTSDEDTSVFIPVATLRRLVEESDALKAVVAETLRQIVMEHEVAKALEEYEATRQSTAGEFEQGTWGG